MRDTVTEGVGWPVRRTQAYTRLPPKRGPAAAVGAVAGAAGCTLQ